MRCGSRYWHATSNEILTREGREIYLGTGSPDYQELMPKMMNRSIKPSGSAMQINRFAGGPLSHLESYSDVLNGPLAGDVVALEHRDELVVERRTRGEKRPVESTMSAQGKLSGSRRFDASARRP